MKVLLGLQWQEDFDAAGRLRYAERVVAALDARLPADAGQRLYVATGHPEVSPTLQAEFAKLAQAEPDLRQVVRQKRSPAYVASRPDLFARVLALVFEWGPPEITALALLQHAAGDPDGLGHTITRLVEQPGPAGPGAVRLEFDENDLIGIA